MVRTVRPFLNALPLHRSPIASRWAAIDGGPAGLLFFSHYDIPANDYSVSLADTRADVRVAPELAWLTRAESTQLRRVVQCTRRCDYASKTYFDAPVGATGAGQRQCTFERRSGASQIAFVIDSNACRDEVQSTS